MVDCPSRNLEQVLLHAQQVGMMAEEHSYIFLSPDIFTLDMDRYRYGGVNMTGERYYEWLSVISLCKMKKIIIKFSMVQNLINDTYSLCELGNPMFPIFDFQTTLKFLTQKAGNAHMRLRCYGSPWAAAVFCFCFVFFFNFLLTI